MLLFLSLEYQARVLLVVFCFGQIYVYCQNKTCGNIYLSIGAKSRRLIMNWHYHKCRRLPDYLILHRSTKDTVEDDTLDVMALKTKYGSYETDVAWNTDIYPGNWTIKNAHPQQKTKICSQYYIASYKKRVLEDSQCLRVYPNWMSRFPNLRLYNIFIPGTQFSGAFGRHQHYDFWGQLVFGIRYFDIKIGMKRERTSNRFHVIPKAESLLDELKKVGVFLRKAKKEIVILDFRKFLEFQNDSDHDILVLHLKHHFNNSIAPMRLSLEEGGPTLKYLWKHNYRIIINYRHTQTVKRYDFLWNHILTEECKSDDAAKVKECLDKSCQHKQSKEICLVVVAELKNDSDVSSVNANLSRWISLNNFGQRINIISVDYFESSNVIVDGIKANRKKRL